jgi:peroxiredoxin Q/BCP
MSDASDLKVGEAAPEFNLPSTTGEMVSLADFRGKQEVVLYFYPKDDTRGCTIEACSFRDNIASVQSRGVALLGVSPDSVDSHQKFTDKFSLNFPLLADEGANLAQTYGVWVEKNRYGNTYMGVDRSTFLIDKDGKLKKIWRGVTPEGHVDDVIKALDG